MAKATESNAQRADKEFAIWGSLGRHLPEELDPREIWWRDRYKQLNTLGYLLRPRYSPEWIPSWKTSKKDWGNCEDGKRLEVRILFSPILSFRTVLRLSLAKSLTQLESRTIEWLLLSRSSEQITLTKSILGYISLLSPSSHNLRTTASLFTMSSPWTATMILLSWLCLYFESTLAQILTQLERG